MWEKDDDVSRDALISLPLLLLLLLLLGIIFVSPLISMPLLPLPLFNAEVEDEKDGLRLLVFLPPPLISPVFFSRSTRRLRLLPVLAMAPPLPWYRLLLLLLP